MSTYGIPDYELGQQRAEAEAGEAFNPISTPMTDAWYKGLSPIMSEAASFSRYLERRLAVVTKDRDEARRHVADLCLPLHDFVQTCGLFDGTDAGRDVAETAVKYANQFKAERDRYKSALIRLHDCNFTISLPDRMDAVRDIAREALGGEQ